jgi:hypothetical protein
VVELKDAENFYDRGNLKHFPSLKEVMLKESGKWQSVLVRRFYQYHRQKQRKDQSQLEYPNFNLMTTLSIRKNAFLRGFPDS